MQALPGLSSCNTRPREKIYGHGSCRPIQFCQGLESRAELMVPKPMIVQHYELHLATNPHALVLLPRVVNFINETSHLPTTIVEARLPAKMGGGGKVPYPKHVWSPAGGWYAQPHNWKSNTMIFGAVIAGCALIAWNVSANREHRYKMPERTSFFPSRK